MFECAKQSLDRFSTKTIASVATGVVVAGAGLSVALTHNAASSPAAPASSVQVTHQDSGLLGPGTEGHSLKLPRQAPTEKSDKKAAMPSGVSTGTSFWDAETASGKPMSFHTIASPYWPLGTKVKITVGKKSAIGVVEDFGPAEWAVAQHNPPAIIDLSEEMMQYFTGTRSNSIPIKFQVLQLGDGPVYRHSGTGYDMATGVSEK